jgi:hypothetical protein
MTSTFTKHSIRVFDELEKEPRWGGWGYLGARRHLLAAYEPEPYRGMTRTQRKKAVRKADLVVVTYANIHRWTREELFEWVDSTLGRHFMDWVVGDTRAPSEIGRDAAARGLFDLNWRKP